MSGYFPELQPLEGKVKVELDFSNRNRLKKCNRS